MLSEGGVHVAERGAVAHQVPVERVMMATVRAMAGKFALVRVVGAIALRGLEISATAFDAELGPHESCLYCDKR